MQEYSACNKMSWQRLTLGDHLEYLAQTGVTPEKQQPVKQK